MTGQTPPPGGYAEARGDDVTPASSLILETCVAGLFHTVLLFSLFLLFAGHNQPGGGFVGGLVAGAAFVLRYVRGGSDEVDRVTPLPAAALVGIGLTVVVGTGAASWLAGGQFLESGKLDIDIPLVGTAHAGSALVFDIGVYVIVLGLVVGVLSSLGRGGDEQAPLPDER